MIWVACRHGDGVHIGHVGQHTAVDLGADHRRTHQVDEAEDEGLGYVIGQGFCAGGQGDAQQARGRSLRGRDADIAGKNARVHLRFSVMQASASPTALEITVDTAAPATPHLREAEEAVDENGVACHVQKVHGQRRRATTSFSRV